MMTRLSVSANSFGLSLDTPAFAPKIGTERLGIRFQSASVEAPVVVHAAPDVLVAVQHGF